MRFRRGRYVIFRRRDDGRLSYFAGFETDRHTGETFPRETVDVDKARPFISAAHGYKYGSERRQLRQWRVGRV